MKLIRTESKGKLPRGFSYPTGAKALSDALAGVPQYAELQIAFSWKDTFWSSEYRAKLVSLGNVTLVEVTYSKRWDEWLIRVHAVPSEHAHAARQWLEGKLDELAAALGAAVSETRSFQWVASYPLSQTVAAGIQQFPTTAGFKRPAGG